jgi:UPF0176 protein
MSSKPSTPPASADLPTKADRGPAFEPGLQHTSFYRFVPLADPDFVADVLRELVKPLTGSVLVAHEGISGALAGSLEQLDTFEAAVHKDARLNDAFADMPFKRSACQTRPFWKVRVQRKEEIVALHLDGVTGVVPDRSEGQHLSPQAWRDLIAQEDVVVIDNRNSFEYRLGRFKNAIDPHVDNRIAIDTHLQETGTTADEVYNDSPDEIWRKERAHRLDAFTPKRRPEPKDD